MSSVLALVVACVSGVLAGYAVRLAVVSRAAPAFPRRSCPQCSALLFTGWFPRLPVSGRCPQCAHRLGPALLVPEAVAGLVFMLLAGTGTSGWSGAAHYWLAACGVALALIDLAVRRLPDVLTGWLAAGVFALLAMATLAGEPGSLGRALAAAAVVSAGFFLLALAGMGAGDVKLAPSIGLVLGWHGWQSVWWGTVAGFFLGSVCAVVLLARGHSRRSTLAFGPFMVAGALATSAWVGPAL